MASYHLAILELLYWQQLIHVFITTMYALNFHSRSIQCAGSFVLMPFINFAAKMIVMLSMNKILHKTVKSFD